MDDFSEIKKAVVDLNLTAKDSAFNHGETDAIGSTETALTLQRVVNTLMADNLELHNRLSAIEAKITTMYAEFSRAEFLHESNDTTRDRCIRPAMHLDPKTTPKRDPDVSHGHTERFSSLGLRTRDLKDQMIADQQERRERTHEAVDDVEAYAKGQPW
ncbi:hypothetical protein N7510_002662 [Penicillium lagena]|uniref:uncharacterized protein n=1 Tax=Penicillium lagena TaxID=94218 RepID=UPI002540D028|nr:uncharacterized protein N7510_002662 [Penicillium lagena]KAJ5626353.1 hypothetical protein N7510_002662 [Penicillium lagena]